MALNNNLPYRQSIRMPGFDYRQPGAYFITICTHGREPLFGHIVDGVMHLNAVGQVVKSVWDDIPAHFSDVALDEYVLMPDHFHGIVVIGECTGTACRARDDGTVSAGTACRARTVVEEFGKPVAGSIATIIRSFKSASTKSINLWRNTPGGAVWHRNYWERIIRDDRECAAVRAYIRNNPSQWST